MFSFDMFTFELDIILRLVIATLLGCIISLERERRIWAAGMRTHMLVSVGSALFMLVSIFGFSDVLGKPGVEHDPSRVAAQVASGIGFLGAGTIIFRRDAVRGLTTAASLWVVAAIGLASGGGLYLAAAATTVLALLILAALKPLERRLFIDRRPQSLVVTASRAKTSLVAIEAALRTSKVDVSYIQWRMKQENAADLSEGLGDLAGDENGSSAALNGDGQYEVEIGLTKMRASDLSLVMDSLRTVPGVSAVSHAR